MIISSQGEACSPNDDIKALDLNGTNALRDRLRQIANSGSGEEALLAGAEINLGVEQAEREQALIEQARQALSDFRDFLAQSSDQAAQAIPSEEALVYKYNPETQECEITRQDGRDIELYLTGRGLQGELPLPPQLMVTKLDCGDNDLTALPELPVSLTQLSCDRNQLTTLPVLPARLARLNCGHNQLASLPELPASLTDLDCLENQLIALPELPASLTNLYCPDNQLTTLPELPGSLTKLDCGDNQLTALPELPARLANLYCSDNQLTTLPELPASLTELECNSNQLITLPVLPDGLTFLSCSRNKLTTLPVLPDSLTRLDCSENPSLARKRATKRNLKAFRYRGGTVIS
jgi:Leucine-rich repeat (LRR) protein